MYVCMCVYVYVHVCMCMCLCICMRMCLCICICLYVCMRIFACTVYVYVRIRMCMCTCTCTCTLTGAIDSPTPLPGCQVTVPMFQVLGDVMDPGGMFIQEAPAHSGVMVARCGRKVCVTACMGIVQKAGHSRLGKGCACLTATARSRELRQSVHACRCGSAAPQYSCYRGGQTGCGRVKAVLLGREPLAKQSWASPP